jgi:5-hydroxyisourate hydrolase
MGRLTTHVLDATFGKPGDGIPVTLEQVGVDPAHIAHATTDTDGRVRQFTPDLPGAGTYRLTFDPTEYFARTGQESFYPSVSITFTVVDGEWPYHVPLLLSPFAYSTYRGV